MITGNNSGIFPDVVLQGSLFETSTSPRHITLTGLDNTKCYNVAFFASANNGTHSTSTITTGSQSVVVDAAYNTNKTVQFNRLHPDASGKITLTYQKDGRSPYGYLSAVIIQSYDSVAVPI